jgi:hypothetical protein
VKLGQTVLVARAIAVAGDHAAHDDEGGVAFQKYPRQNS